MNVENLSGFANAGLELVSLLEERDHLGLNELLMSNDVTTLKALFHAMDQDRLQEALDSCADVLAYLGTQGHARLIESIESLEKLVTVLSDVQSSLVPLANDVNVMNLEQTLVDRQAWLQRKITACIAVL